MTLDLPNLQILEVSKLAVHEHHDDQRTPPLIARLRASGYLRNPPIVTPLNDGSNRYMVLDGTNRTTAFSKMGIPHIIVQVVAADSTQVEIHTWNHVLWGINSETLLSGLNNINHFKLIASKDDLETAWKNKALIWVQTAEGNTFTGKLNSNHLNDRIKGLNDIVNSYKDVAKVDRTRANTTSELDGIYEEFCGIIVFPPIEMNEVIELCIEGTFLPAGFTRFAISPRALRINYSLDDLAAGTTLEEKNLALERWIQERLARKGVRVYTEATVVFDE